jgi:PAS domain S-box-containing protein
MPKKPNYEELELRVKELQREVARCRRAEKEALAGKEKYRSTIKNAVWGVFQTTPEGRFLSANQALANILGYETPDDLMTSISNIGNQLFVKPAQRNEMLRRLAKQDMILAFEAQIYRKDKSIIWLSLSHRAIKDPKGRLLYVEGFVEDVTERKRLEEQLKKHRQNLELLVEQRTAELVEINEALKRENAEREAAEDAVRKSEERYRSLIENLPIGLYRNTPGPKGQFIMANPAIARMFGCETVDEFLQTSVAELYWNPADRQVFSEKLKAQGYVVSEELKLKNLNNGTPFWGAVTVNVVRDESGEIKYFDGLIEDISDRKRAEEALEFEKRRFQTLLEYAPFGIVMIGKDNTWQYINPKFKEMFGYDLSDIHTGKQWFRLAYPDRDYRRWVIGQWIEWIENVRPGGEAIPATVTVHCKDGTEKIIHLRMVQLHTGDYLLTCEDVTELKHTEKALQEREERIRSIMEGAPDPMAVYDTEGKLTYSNPAFTRVFGWTLDELKDKKVDYVPKECWPETQMMIEKLKRGEGFQVVETRRFTKSGDVLNISVSAAAFSDSEGNFMGSVTTLRDITNRKKAEEELQKAKDAAEAANRAKSTFVANISHEIRTPLNSIMGMSHLALKTDLSPQQYDYLSKMQSSANALLGIINDILDFSKIEAGKMRMESVVFQMEEVLNSLKNLVAIKAQEKGLELLFHIAPDVPQYLVGDPLRLEQVLINLANNAVKFTKEGEIVICAELVNGETEQVTLRFSVRDTGIGLTQDQISKLFEAFSQVDTTTTRKYGGTGLGLTISKYLVNMMGSFTATFTEALGIEKKCFVPPQDLRGMRVMVVDDNATFRELIKEMLESFTFEVTVTASGKEGLAKLEKDSEKNPYELVIIDWRMPEMDGIKVSQLIKNHPELPKIPAVILVTASGREEVMQRFQQAGLDGFLFKPISYSLLFDTIIEIFGYKDSRKPLIMTKGTEETEALKQIRGAKILVAEDNEINRQVAKELLEKVGLIVTVANNGKSAVKAAAEAHYDLVLMDIQMPEMDGFEATRHIRTNSKAGIEDLPIIATTAHAMTGDREKSLEAGLNDYLSKPIDPDRLYSALLKWIKPKERQVSDQPDSRISEKDADQEILVPPEMPGIMVKSGLAGVGGNARLYRDILIKFYRDYSNATQQIKNALEKGDIELAQHLVHTIKGLSGTIGAQELHVSAGELEASIQHGYHFEIEGLLNVFDNALVKVLDSLKGFARFRDEPVKGKRKKGKADPQKLLALLSKLAPYVQKRKPKQCNSAMGEIVDLSWPDEYAPDLANLGRLIESYKFKEAQEILELIITKLKAEDRIHA